MTPKLLFAAAVLSALATPALAAGELADGKYQCVMDDNLPNGEIVISGNTYQGPDYDGQFEGTFTFSVSADNITWNGPLGIYRDGFELIGSSVVKDPDGANAIEIHLRQSGGDVIHTVYCNPE